MEFPKLLLVYGTLMKGFSNHHLVNGCRFVGRAATVNLYGLFVADFPFVTEKVGSSKIFGEVYEIPNEDVLAQLDDLEEHPRWYERKPIKAVVLGNNMEINVELYFNENYDLEGDVEAVPTGRFEDSVKSAGLR